MLRILSVGRNIQTVVPVTSSLLSRLLCAQQSLEKTENIKSTIGTNDDKINDQVVHRDAEERPSFNRSAILDLLVEKFDPELLYMPQILNADKWMDLVTRGEVLENSLKEIKYDEVLKNNRIDQDIRIKLRELNIMKSTIPEEYGGYGLTDTEEKYMHEILSRYPSVARMVAERKEMGIATLIKYGTEEQKQKYLPRLASGESTVTFAFLENSSTLLDSNSYFNTKVIAEGDKFVIRGRKSWVYDAVAADVIIVFATQTVQDEADELLLHTLFIVDRKEDGVLVHSPMEKNWLKGLDVCDVTFADVVVGAKNIIGRYGKGYEILKDMLKTNRTHLTAECSAIMKRLVHDAVKKCEANELFGKPLSGYKYAHLGIGDISSLTYAVESVTYYLASRADYFSNADFTLESIIAKLFATDALLEALHKYFSLVGKYGYEKGLFVEELVQNAHYYSLLEDTKYNMKLFLITEGIIYAGRCLNEKIMKLRNPGDNPYMMIKYTFEKSDHESDFPPMKLALYKCVHMNAIHCANHLEYCIGRLRFCVEKHLFKYGKKSLEADAELLIISDILIYTYAAMACLARVHKTCSLKMLQTTEELKMAESFTSKAVNKVRSLSSLLGWNEEEMASYQEIGRKALTNKLYFPEHPLMRNF